MAQPTLDAKHHSPRRGGRIALGPLRGIKVIEFGGIGPGPFCGMVLADMGAEVVRLDRRVRFDPVPHPHNLLLRNRRSLILDLKKPAGREAALRLVQGADALLEGFRPGVMERLGLGPDECLAANPALVYGRMTGWGQEGPLARAAGHDINYIALTGLLSTMGRASDKPAIPLNLIGDFGGGGMLLAFGLVCGLLEARSSGQGQVVDAAMVDGASLLMTMYWAMKASGQWSDQREDNLLDGGAPFYDVYETADHGYVTVGPLEPQFYDELLRLTGLERDPELTGREHRANWPVAKQKLAQVFRSKTRAQWQEIMEGSDACFAPMLSMAEATQHPHNQARGTFIQVKGQTQPAPAPRFSRTPAAPPRPPADPGADSQAVLADWGFSQAEIKALRRAGVL